MKKVQCQPRVEKWEWAKRAETRMNSNESHLKWPILLKTKDHALKCRLTEWWANILKFMDNC